MTKNQLIKIISFMLIVVFITLCLGRVFYYSKSDMRKRIYTYSTLKENTVDAVFIGTSGVARFWIPGESFHNYGLTVYPLTIDGLQCWHALTLAKYALKTQSPKVIMVDTRSFTVDEDTSRCEYRSRYLVDVLPTFSELRAEAAARAVKYLGELGVENRLDITYYFNILRYHDMWQDGFDFSAIKNESSKFYGFNFTKVASHIKEIPESAYTDKSTPLVWFAQECLDELIGFCDENNVELVFVNSPHCENESTYERTNYLYDYLDKKGIAYFDCVTKEGLEQHPFDRSKDFYNEGHVNYWGGKKFTSYVSEYLIDEYKLADHRGDKEYKNWEDCYQDTLKKAIKNGICNEDGSLK